MEDLFKLAGIGVVIVGMVRRWRPTVVVVIAALLTGLAAGIPLLPDEPLVRRLFEGSGGVPGLWQPGSAGLLSLLGNAFAENRLMTLFLLTLPAIGLAERYGLREESAALIRRLRGATVGRIHLVYQLFRILHGALGIRLNGHPSFVRPLIAPMATGAAEVASPRGLADDPTASDRIKAAGAAAENYGNFYGQNLSPVQAGVLLVFGVMQGLGVPVAIWDLVRATVPVVVVSVILAALQFWWLDRWLRRRARQEAR